MSVEIKEDIFFLEDFQFLISTLYLHFDRWQNDNFDFRACGGLCRFFAFLFRPSVFSTWFVFSYLKFYK